MKAREAFEQIRNKKGPMSLRTRMTLFGTVEVFLGLFIALGTSLKSPAATAANIAAPRAQVCSLAEILTGIFRISAHICMTNGALRLIPPAAVIELIGKFSFLKCSMIALEPKSVLSTRAR